MLRRLVRDSFYVCGSFLPSCIRIHSESGYVSGSGSTALGKTLQLTPEKKWRNEADLSTRLQSEQSWLNLHWSASLWAILGNGQVCRQFCQKFAISRSDPPPPPPPIPDQPKNLNFKFCIEFQLQYRQYQMRYLRPSSKYYSFFTVGCVWCVHFLF